MGVAGIEGEIGGAEDVSVGVRSRTEAVVIAKNDDVGHAEFFENIALGFKLLSSPKVADVASVDNKVDVGAGIDASDGSQCLVVPTLGVADEHEAHTVAPAGGSLDASHAAGVDAVGTIDTHVVGMIINEVARSEGCQTQTDA